MQSLAILLVKVVKTRTWHDQNKRSVHSSSAQMEPKMGMGSILCNHKTISWFQCCELWPFSSPHTPSGNTLMMRYEKAPPDVQQTPTIMPTDETKRNAELSLVWPLWCSGQHVINQSIEDEQRSLLNNLTSSRQKWFDLTSRNYRRAFVLSSVSGTARRGGCWGQNLCGASRDVRHGDSVGGQHCTL